MKAKDKKDKTFPVLKGKIPIDTEEELAKKLFEKKDFSFNGSNLLQS